MQCISPNAHTLSATEAAHKAPCSRVPVARPLHLNDCPSPARPSSLALRCGVSRAALGRLGVSWCWPVIALWICLELLIEDRHWTHCDVECVSNLRKRLSNHTHSA